MQPSARRSAESPATWLLEAGLWVFVCWALVRPPVWAVRQFLPFCLWLAGQPVAGPAALPALWLLALTAGFLLGYLPMRLLAAALAVSFSRADRNGAEPP